MGKKYVVALDEGIKGSLPRNTGTFRALIDEESSGAKHFSMMVNTMYAGIDGVEHKHDVEHCWYILSGTGTMYVAGEPFDIGPDMAVFAPADTLHKIVVGPDEDLTYVLIYAPSGPEKQLKEKGADAFGSDK